MKERQKKMLRLLLNQKDRLRIEDLAQVFSIGKRTVSRDLDNLDHWLSLKGARLERTPGQGIQVSTYGCRVEDLLGVINKPGSYIEALEPDIRQKLLLLYLLYYPREIKIADMASSFFISDTSVWNDLNLIENKLNRPTLSLTRHKGVGIQLVGEESQIRLEFLSVLTNLISPKTVIPYLYQLNKDRPPSLEQNQLNYYLEKLKFPGNKRPVLDLLSQYSRQIGYQFTMSGEALLYFYLQLTFHRIQSGCLIEKHFEDSPYHQRYGKELLGNLSSQIFSGTLPEGEVSFFNLIMRVQEMGTIPLTGMSMEQENQKKLGDLRGFTSDLISGMGQIDNRLYYLNESIEVILNRTISSLITRQKYGIPFWHGDWGEGVRALRGDEKKIELLEYLLHQYFSIQGDPEDLDYILLYFQSLFLEKRDVPLKKIRCLVCCFEGIGLASYLQTILQRDIKNIDIVEATAVFKIKQEYLDEKRIELVISTFPISGLTSPLILLSLPVDRAVLIKDISDALTKMKPEILSDFSEKKISPLEEKNDEISFGTIMDFIGSFDFVKVDETDNIEEIINHLSGYITGGGKDKKKLALSFMGREKLGSLFFEEYGIRVLHCKSGVIKKPRAGVIGFPDSRKDRMLFLIAPDPCPENIRKILSTITLSFMDIFSFRDSLLRGDINKMRRSLMDIYKELI